MKKDNKIVNATIAGILAVGSGAPAMAHAVPDQPA